MLIAGWLVFTFISVAFGRRIYSIKEEMLFIESFLYMTSRWLQKMTVAYKLLTIGYSLCFHAFFFSFFVPTRKPKSENRVGADHQIFSYEE